MKKLLLILIPVAIYAQVIDTVIRFPDDPWDLFYVPEGNELYINFGRSNYLMVLDCSTYQNKKTILTGGNFQSIAYGLWNQSLDKIYYAFNISPERIAVIDNSTDSIIRWVNFHGKNPLCYNLITNKIYATNGQSVAVIDCVTDSIIKIITQPYYLSGFVLWDSIGNKIYCGSGLYCDEVTVVNCINDSVVAVINSNVSAPYKAIYNYQRRKVYVASDLGVRGAVIDAINDTLIKNFYPIGLHPLLPFVWNSLENKVYWPSFGDTLVIIDCLNDSIIKKVYFGFQNEYISYLCLIPWSNRLYVTTNNYSLQSSILRILDCQNDSIVSEIEIGKSCYMIICNPENRKIYLSDLIDSSLYVIKDEIPGIEKHQTLDALSLMPEIYPNPAKSFLAVRLPLTAERQTLKIFDVTGKMIKIVDNVTNAQEHRQEVKISLKGINPGIYFFEIGKVVKKFIVAK
ncbi:MAG: T9SS type A sorting domain-containing protein [Candidatus Bathyarchaeota archaeon]|nr:T9SS type A sorting domain-containing protein [Candidatus Bathyarchaeota archaeon]